MLREDMQNCVDAIEHLLYDVEEDPDEFKPGAAESLKRTLNKFKSRSLSNVYLGETE